MKTTFLYVTMLLMMLIQFTNSGYAQNNPDEDDVIEITITENTVETPPKRTPSIIPLRAFYLTGSNTLEIDFTHSVGEVSFILTNYTTLNSSIYVVESSNLTILLPFANETGSYRLEIYTETDESYIGSFIKY